jgi:3-deoxy-D-manno-octulosonic-acid transferase
VGQDEPLLRFGRGAPTLVAGSTWPEDEAVLLAAFARVRATHHGARLVLVPHEPTERHLMGAERTAARLRVPPPRRMSQAQEPVPLLLVDRVGLLARLYGVGTMAYVGGGFGGAGLHSVLEPAAWGMPVCFGPRWKESRDAAALLQAGAARALACGGEAAVEELAEIWTGWIEREDEREAAGNRAKTLVEHERGASARSAELLAELISSRRPRTSPSGEL